MRKIDNDNQEKGRLYEDEENAVRDTKTSKTDSPYSIDDWVEYLNKDGEYRVTIEQMVKCSPKSFKEIMEKRGYTETDVKKHYPAFTMDMLDRPLTDAEKRIEEAEKKARDEWDKKPKTKWDRFQIWALSKDIDDLESETDRAMWLAIEYFHEIMNGGHLQFFSNKGSRRNLKETQKLFERYFPKKYYDNFVSALKKYEKEKQLIDGIESIRDFSKVAGETDFEKEDEFGSYEELGNAIKKIVNKHFNG